jgi:hypothetical protein
MRRLCSKGSENNNVSLERLYHRVAAATHITFPNVSQVALTEDELEEAAGDNRTEALAGLKARVNHSGGVLHKANFVVETASS